MARAFIRGKSFMQYLKSGYNIVRRFQRGEEPDNENDLFEYIMRCKTEKRAKSQIKKLDFEAEIMEFKTSKEDTPAGG